MIKLFGCSFTNWIYPTWADFVCMHYDAECTIYGKPGIGNQAIKKLLLLSAERNNHCIVMLSGIDRLEQGVDREFYDASGFYNHKDSVTKHHWLNNFVSKDLKFVPMKHNSSKFTDDFSLFHALYTQAELIVDLQNLSKACEFNFKILNWQHMFGDASTRKQNAGICKPVNLKRYKQNPIFDRVHSMIDNKFILDRANEGLLNFVHNDRQLFDYQNNWDSHPSCIAHFYYFKKFIKPYLDNFYKSNNNIENLFVLAEKFSQFYKNCNASDPLIDVENNNQLVHDKFFSARHKIIETWFNEYSTTLSCSHNHDLI